MPRLTNATIALTGGTTILAPFRTRSSHRIRLVATSHVVLLTCLIPLTASPGEPPTQTDAERAKNPLAAATTASDSASPASPTKADIAALRAATIEQLKVLQPSSTIETAKAGGSSIPEVASPSTTGAISANSGGTSPATEPAGTTAKAMVKSPLRELFDERIRLLDEYEKTNHDLNNVIHAEPSPERLAADTRDELRELEAVLSRASQDPETLLPALFLSPSVEGSRTLPAEMKAALEATSTDLKEARNRLESIKSEAAKSEHEQNARRTARDQMFQGLANLKVKTKEYELAVTEAPSVEARQLARERQLNFQWKLRVRSLQLQLLEARLAQEAKLDDVRALRIQTARARIQVGVKTLAQMNVHYRAAVLDQETKLKRAAAAEDEKARRTDDPLERFRAFRSADLYRMEIPVLKYEQALATNPSPSYEEQKMLADRADDDFARIKKLIADGSVSRLDAIRLNNEFRRIAPERDRLIKNELATVEAQIQYYESVLTNVEIELIQGSLQDFEHELVRERLPRSRWAEGEAVLTALEKRHQSLLIRERDALESLNDRAGHTLHELVRRLDKLDEEYGFIRTSIFWVRDQEPMGVETLSQEVRECHYLANGLLRLAREWINGKLWNPPSAEFMATALAGLVLPIGLGRLRKLMRVWIERDLPKL